MADVTLHQRACTCPRCAKQGKSVAAMNYAETQYWDKRGTFSGSGVGIGTGGVGIGFGGGLYYESGTAQSKRAQEFEEPEESNKAHEEMSMVLLGIVFLGLVGLLIRKLAT